jgi:dTDP-N-acetylfucosamine:lipid II N-acetylfucosaminyltransferase
MIFHLVVNHRHSVTFLSNANRFFDPDKHRFVVLQDLLQPYDWRQEMWGVSTELKFLNSLEVSAGDCIVVHSLFMKAGLLDEVFAARAQLGVKIVWSSWGSDFLRHIANPLSQVFSCVDCLMVNRSAFQNHRFPESLVVDNDTKFYLDPTTHDSRNKEKDAVLVGNSGDPSNNHFEILEKINTDYKIIIPVSYNGEAQHREYLESWAKGKRNLVILDSVLDSKSYIEMLDSVKLSIYAHNRQQGTHTARIVYGLGGNVCTKKMITDTSGVEIVNPGYVALFETGCPDLIDFDDVDAITNEYLESLQRPRQGSFFTASWQQFYFKAFESRWSSDRI